MGKAGIKIRDIEHLREIFRSSPFDVKSVYLFGSRARGDFLEGSDWDILIVSPDFANIPFPERATFVLKRMPLRGVELLCYTEEEFEKKSEEIGIVQEALKGEKIHYESESSSS